MPEPPRIRYEVRAPTPSDHRIEVRMTVDGVVGGAFDVVFPSWVPGSYWIQDRVRNVSGLDARVPGSDATLPVHRTEKARWRVASGEHPSVEVRFTVYGNEPRTSLLDVTSEHLFLGAGFALPYVEGRSTEPFDLVLSLPPDWTIHTELPEVTRHPPTFRASGFDELVDSPVDAGHAESFVIHPLGIPHRIVLCGAGGNYEADRLQRDIGRVVEASVRLFGDSPLPSYTFFYHLTHAVWAGLEHARSNHCVFPRSGFRTPSQYRTFLRLTAHEYLHLYNVKRIHPKAFDPFDYTRETYTRLLWAMEGTTDYLAWLVLIRAGLTSPERALTDLAEKIRRYRATPGRLRQSLEDASVAAWVDFYHGDEETPNRSISYYLKGELVSLCLDLELRAQTQAASSIESVWRELWTSYGKTNRGLEEDELPGVIERVTGVHVDEFFRDYIAGTKEVDFERYFGLAGLALRPRSGPRRPDDDPEPGYLGVDTENANGSVRVTSVRDGSPGRRAGLSPLDEIVAVDGSRISFDDWTKVLGRYAPGSPLELTVFRRGRLRSVPAVAGESPPKELSILPEKEASPAV
ncbi:MAG: PDZ domain-containing protein, partial [Thermoplasmata archaeon]|nr:PDZ domain-containing protein [Thermoplasmata archaeon]